MSVRFRHLPILALFALPLFSQIPGDAKTGPSAMSKTRPATSVTAIGVSRRQKCVAESDLGYCDNCLAAGPEELVLTKLVASPRLDDDGKWQNASDRHMMRVATQLDRDRIFETLFAALSSLASDQHNTATVVTQDGAWCWFQDPRAVYIEGQHKRTYLQWMTHDGKLQMGAFDHKTRGESALSLPSFLRRVHPGGKPTGQLEEEMNH